jgi:hypothetical protein
MSTHNWLPETGRWILQPQVMLQRSASKPMPNNQIAKGPQYHPMIGRKRPATVEYWYWDGNDDTAAAIVEWVNSSNTKHVAEKHPHEPVIIIDPNAPPSMGYEPLRPGCWLIRDTFGDFWALPDSIFQGTYESVI